MDKSELEARAKARRAYLQGGPGNNDPKNLGFPGEIKYPRMEVPVGGDARQWEQQWFEGAAAESKQKMGPSGTELELKKKLQRAKLSAKFTRKANSNESFWEFFATDKDSGAKGLVFSASLNEISGQNGQALSEKEVAWFSSPDYARYTMNEMRTHGPERVSYALKGIGLTREGTMSIIREQALHKARRTHVLGRRVARTLSIAGGKLKTALAHDYADLQHVLEDLRLVDKNVAKLASIKASDQNRFVIYKLADEALMDAETALGDILANIETAEATMAARLSKKAEDMPEAEQTEEAAPMADAAPAPMAGGVDNPSRAKEKSAPMPGGGMPYTPDQLYPAGDERGTAKMNDMQPAAHGDLPYREWEQLELKNLADGPHGTQRSFDKAQSPFEALQVGPGAGTPTGELANSQEAAGGGLSHVDESQEPSPGLNPEVPRWGFDGKPGSYMNLEFGGEAAAAPAPMADAPAGEAEEDAPEEETEEAAPEEEESEAEEKAEETKEPAKEEEEEEEETEEDEEKDAEASSRPADRQARVAARAKVLKAATEMSPNSFAELYGKNPDFAKLYGSNPDFAKYYGLNGEKAAPAAAPAAPKASEAEDADAAVKASFDPKKSEAATKEALVKQKRAYDLALHFQAKNWIEPGTDALHRHAAQLLSLDDNSFQVFKSMADGVKTIDRQAAVAKEEKIQKVAGTQRKVTKSPAPMAGDETLLNDLAKLPWS